MAEDIEGGNKNTRDCVLPVALLRQKYKTCRNLYPLINKYLAQERNFSGLLIGHSELNRIASVVESSREAWLKKTLVWVYECLSSGYSIILRLVPPPRGGDGAWGGYNWDSGEGGG